MSSDPLAQPLRTGRVRLTLRARRRSGRPGRQLSQTDAPGLRNVAASHPRVTTAAPGRNRAAAPMRRCPRDASSMRWHAAPAARQGMAGAERASACQQTPNSGCRRCHGFRLRLQDQTVTREVAARAPARRRAQRATACRRCSARPEIVPVAQLLARHNADPSRRLSRAALVGVAHPDDGSQQIKVPDARARRLAPVRGRSDRPRGWRSASQAADPRQSPGPLVSRSVDWVHPG